jgi:hypothetical protein
VCLQNPSRQEDNKRLNARNDAKVPGGLGEISASMLNNIIRVRFMVYRRPESARLEWQQDNRSFYILAKQPRISYYLA